MSKSVYSLVLNDEVVEIIDRMARINGLSRSNMIEKILADAVEYETPEIRADNIFEEIERIIKTSQTMRYLSQPSQYMASIMSALDYRYNPAIKYSVELFPNSDHLGQLKVTLRTQNVILINLISDFYTFYTYLEKKYYNPNAVFMFDGAKFTRLFDFPKVNVTTKVLAEKLTEYVKDFDELLNVYFNNLTADEKRLLYLVEKRYLELKQNSFII
ncbi:MAG: ribbon-helix-helix protein, CopG family [Clostridia bacterium]|nr:ribbon-helix-helix protein, CopG family [Clostridia bacterium]